MKIREASRDDGRAIAELYNYYVLNTDITFEIEPRSPKQMTELIANVKGKGYPFLVADEGEEIAGFCYINNWLTRAGFRSTAELVVYIHRDHLRKGIATALSREILARAKDISSIHMIVSLVTMPSCERTVGILKHLGFNKEVELKEIGRKFNEWKDKELWALKFE